MQVMHAGGKLGQPWAYQPYHAGALPLPRFGHDPEPPQKPSEEKPDPKTKSFCDHTKEAGRFLARNATSWAELKKTSTTAWTGSRPYRRKFTNWKRFKRSMANGYTASKDDWQDTLRSKSSSRIAKRVGKEAVGVAVLIAFALAPGPNPGWFLSPTTHRFFKGFFKLEADEKP